jgi:hypothetical protein
MQSGLGTYTSIDTGYALGARPGRLLPEPVAVTIRFRSRRGLHIAAPKSDLYGPPDAAWDLRNARAVLSRTRRGVTQLETWAGEAWWREKGPKPAVAQQHWLWASCR